MQEDKKIKKNASSQLEQFINAFENNRYDEIEELEEFISESEENTAQDVSALEQFLDYIGKKSLNKASEGAKEEFTPDENNFEEDRKKKAMDLAIMMGMPHGSFKKPTTRKNETNLKEPKMGIDDKDAHWKVNEAGEFEPNSSGIDKDRN